MLSNGCRQGARPYEVIKIGIQAAACHLAGVECLESAGGGIARVGKERLLVELALAVEALELLPGHQNLASYLKETRPAFALELKRYRFDGLDIGRDHVTALAVTARHGAHKAPVLIDERYRCAVEFHFAHNIKLFAAKPLAHTAEPFIDLPDRVCVGERQHRVYMLCRLEPLHKVGPHALRRRKGVGKFRMLFLQRLKLFEEHIEIAVGNLRSVEHVIVMVVAVNLPAELLDAFGGGHWVRILRCGCSVDD